MSETQAAYNTRAAVLDMAIAYTCCHCHAHLGVYVWSRNRMCVDAGAGSPQDVMRGWCPICGRQYHYTAPVVTLDKVGEWREQKQGIEYIKSSHTT